MKYVTVRCSCDTDLKVREDGVEHIAEMRDTIREWSRIAEINRRRIAEMEEEIAILKDRLEATNPPPARLTIKQLRLPVSP